MYEKLTRIKALSTNQNTKTYSKMKRIVAESLITHMVLRQTYVFDEYVLDGYIEKEWVEN